MANYTGSARTNYVSVHDIKGLAQVLRPWSIRIITNPLGQVALLDDEPRREGWLDDEGGNVKLDVAQVIMPFVAEGEVLVLMEAGHEMKHFISGRATAWVRQGDDVQSVQLSLNDIYQLAADQFGVSKHAITGVSY